MDVFGFHGLLKGGNNLALATQPFSLGVPFNHYDSFVGEPFVFSGEDGRFFFSAISNSRMKG